MQKDNGISKRLSKIKPYDDPDTGIHIEYYLPTKPIPEIPGGTVGIKMYRLIEGRYVFARGYTSIECIEQDPQALYRALVKTFIDMVCEGRASIC